MLKLHAPPIINGIIGLGLPGAEALARIQAGNMTPRSIQKDVAEIVRGLGTAASTPAEPNFAQKITDATKAKLASRHGTQRQHQEQATRNASRFIERGNFKRRQRTKGE